MTIPDYSFKKLYTENAKKKKRNEKWAIFGQKFGHKMSQAENVTGLFFYQ
jgi:hypothetical protein